VGIDVQAYSIGAFQALLEKYSSATPALITKKLESRYYEDYFAATAVKTIVIEEPYVDRDYLDDFSAYYVKCFHEYRRHCARLHFFREQFDAVAFSNCVCDKGAPLRTVLADSYAGFVVVRPLPRTIIGRTCLMHYDDDGGRRSFPTAIDWNANLFGIPLAVTTVPFQEQDRVTAACATSALWSAFQVTGLRFQHGLPSPVEITRTATQRMPLRSRALPNADGLTIEQMAHAISMAGLEPYYVDATRAAILRAAVRAYVSAGIPALLIFQLTGEKAGVREVIGLHAATVTGFSTPPGAASTGQFGPVSLRSERMDKLYVHDDQVGPHARMEFLTGTPTQMSTSWGLGGQHANVLARAECVLFPLYNKIRIPFSQPLEDLLTVGMVLRALAPFTASLQGLEWDLRLATISQFRDDLHSWPTPASNDHSELLSKNLPRFLWVATAWNGNARIVDMVFDATDIESGRYILIFRIHDSSVEAVLRAVTATPSSLASVLQSVLDKVAT
jgi:hypothetical protein